MCMTPQNEQYAAVDDTAEWGVKHLRQPRNNVIPLPTKPVHELQAHVKPVQGARPIHLRIAMAVARVWMLGSDFTAFWSIGRVPAVIVALLCIAIVSMLAGWAYQELSLSDWGEVLAVIGALP